LLIFSGLFIKSWNNTSKTERKKEICWNLMKENLMLWIWDLSLAVGSELIVIKICCYFLKWLRIYYFYNIVCKSVPIASRNRLLIRISRTIWWCEMCIWDLGLTDGSELRIDNELRLGRCFGWYYFPFCFLFFFCLTFKFLLVW